MYIFALVAGLLALYFVVASLRQPQPAKLLAAILWAIYSVYEFYVANGTLCDANCNIRVDLVFLFPVLGIATYLGLKNEPSLGSVLILCAICLGIVALLAAAIGYVALAVISGMGALVAILYGIKSRTSGNHAS